MVSRVFFGSVPPYHAYAWLKEVLKSLFFFLFLKGFLSPQSKAMGILLLFAIFLFTCGFINYYRFLPRSQIIEWLCSLLPADSSPPKLADKHSKVEEEEDDDDDDEIGSLASDDDDLQIIFSTFDKDGDGFITVKELEESLRRLGLTITDNELVSMVERVDANGDGLIDLEEFRELYAEVGRDRESGNGDDGHERDEIAKEEEEDVSLREAFGVFDGNGDGMITAEELAMVLSSLGLKQGARLEDCREMIRRVDRDGDGKVNFKEFKNMMKMKRGKLF